MYRKGRSVCVLASLFALAALAGARAEDAKPTDEGKAEDFKGKAFDIKEKGKAAFTLAFPAGRKATVTVKSEKQTDINLFVYDAGKKEVAKDDSPGPDCEVSFTPKEAGRLTLVVVNKGPGANRSGVKVALGKE
jgi:hypothetical protein